MNENACSTTWKLALASGLVAVVILGACGDDDTVAAPASASNERAVVEVVGADFSYEGIPESIEVGTELTLSNDSDVELHEVVAVRLPEDEQRSVEDLLQLPPGEFSFGAPSTVILTAPGGDGILAVGSGVLDQPGRYALFCAIPIGADPDEYLEAAKTSVDPPVVPGGAPHFTAGMFAEVTVTG